MLSLVLGLSRCSVVWRALPGCPQNLQTQARTGQISSSTSCLGVPPQMEADR